MQTQHSNDRLLLKDQSKSLEGRAVVERKAIEEQLKREPAEKKVMRAAKEIKSLRQANQGLQAENKGLKNQHILKCIFG